LKRSFDGRALILRLHETRGAATDARVDFSRPRVSASVHLRAFEIKTLRLEKDGRIKEVDLVGEKGARSENMRREKSILNKIGSRI
jgi:hypothetical protein